MESGSAWSYSTARGFLDFIEDELADEGDFVGFDVDDDEGAFPKVDFNDEADELVGALVGLTVVGDFVGFDVEEAEGSFP